LSDLPLILPRAVNKLTGLRAEGTAVLDLVVGASADFLLSEGAFHSNGALSNVAANGFDGIANGEKKSEGWDCKVKGKDGSWTGKETLIWCE